MGHARGDFVNKLKRYFGKMLKNNYFEI